jgi:hypothetical protein
MDKILSSGTYHLFVDINKTMHENAYNVEFSTTLDSAKNPTQHRRVFSHILNKSEIKTLIEVLESAMRDENTKNSS